MQLPSFHVTMPLQLVAGARNLINFANFKCCQRKFAARSVLDLERGSGTVPFLPSYYVNVCQLPA